MDGQNVIDQDEVTLPVGTFKVMRLELDDAVENVKQLCEDLDKNRDHMERICLLAGFRLGKIDAAIERVRGICRNFEGELEDDTE